MEVGAPSMHTVNHSADPDRKRGLFYHIQELLSDIQGLLHLYAAIHVELQDWGRLVEVLAFRPTHL